MARVPMPNEVHPDYADRPELAAWVEKGSDNPLAIPLPDPSAESLIANYLGSGDATPPITEVPGFNVVHLVRKRCAGPAPWVGVPFRYEWWVGQDEAGRCVAGDARVVHMDLAERLMRGLP